MFNATRFKTLMLREWLQNRWTWLIAVSALPAMVLLLLPIGEVRLPQDRLSPTVVAMGTLVVTAMVFISMAWATTLFTATNLARRDMQDRSIEFWLSLPSTHAEHVGSQYLMHALVFPLGALALGVGAGAVMSPLVLLKWQGASILGQVDWAVVSAATAQFLALAGAVLVLLGLWLSPVVLVLMAASAWVKRLALPLIAGLLTLLTFAPTLGLHFRSFMREYADCINQLIEGLFHVMATSFGRAMLPQGDHVPALAPAQFFGQAGGNLLTPHFAVAVAVALTAAGLLVTRRRRGG